MSSYDAVKVHLDPTPKQERLMVSHAGAARFAYNAGLAHVKEALEHGEPPEWSHYALLRWWNANKDELAVNRDTGVSCGGIRTVRKPIVWLYMAWLAVSRTGQSPAKDNARARGSGSHGSSRKTPLCGSHIPQTSRLPQLVTPTG